VWNDSRGVVIEAFGERERLEAFLAGLSKDVPPAARVIDLQWKPIPWRNEETFTIAPSDVATERNVSIPPDLAVCNDCLREILDPDDRRYLYPFTNCTNCGPRYTISRDVPYDRASTTMSVFEMCDACRAEYYDPLNRRFHAQPNACPDCGPRVRAVTPQGQEINSTFPLRFAARAMRAQMIVAVKGLGGFHLACDATSSSAVQRLRDRKRRDAKPFAVMVGSMAMAEEIADLSDQDRELLRSPERPIVLVRRKAGALIAREVCGKTPLVGLMLPYTPLHHILLREFAHPLVMTSGNVSDEPMLTTNRDALAQLNDIADLFLLHNRDIETRADDSIARVIGGSATVLRRARGYVPRGIRLGRPFEQPVLAVGAQLKNAVCLGVDSTAYLGAHVGDLENMETIRSFESSVDQLQRFVGVKPAVVAHDMHPDYFSTHYAESIPNATIVPVQHHHAHIAAVMAEHQLPDRVVGVAYDGTGFGLDGTSWGGEIMIAGLTGFDRFATFRPIRLAGGDQAIRQVWRIALALVDEAFDGTPPMNAIPLFREIPRRGIDAVRRLVAHGFHAPLARGIGRYFDAFGSLILGVPDARYEGEVAFLWNSIADPEETGHYPVVIHDAATPWEVDMRPAVKAAVLDMIAGRPSSTISARFHNTLADVTIELVKAAQASLGDMPAVLSGGCFQNARLAEHVIRALRPGAGAFMSQAVPPGDGGIALGQAVIADAIVRSGRTVAAEALEVAACV
jgi:hydrogenase maturation protein HypF